MDDSAACRGPCQQTAGVNQILTCFRTPPPAAQTNALRGQQGRNSRSRPWWVGDPNPSRVEWGPEDVEAARRHLVVELKGNCSSRAGPRRQISTRIELPQVQAERSGWRTSRLPLSRFFFFYESRVACMGLAHPKGKRRPGATIRPSTRSGEFRLLPHVSCSQVDR